MKKVITIVLSCALSFAFISCGTQTVDDNSDGESKAISQAASASKVSSVANGEEQTGVGGDVDFLDWQYEERAYFMDIILEALEKTEGSTDKYMQWEKTWSAKLRSFGTAEEKMEYKTKEPPVIYMVIQDLKIDKAAFIAANTAEREKYEELFAKTGEKDNAPERFAFTDEEINLLFSDDVLAVKKRFLSPTSIMVGEKTYSPRWFLQNSAEKYRAEGITKAAFAKAFDSIKTEITLSSSELASLNEKLSKM